MSTDSSTLSIRTPNKECAPLTQRRTNRWIGAAVARFALSLDWHRLNAFAPPGQSLGVTLSSKAMNIILTLMLAFMPAAFPFQQSPSLVGPPKENLPVSVNDLRKARTAIVLDGRSLSLSAYPWRDFMPSSLPAPDGSPMMVVLKVATTDKKPFPSGVRMDRAWVLFGEQLWEASQFRGRVKSPPYDKDGWINCGDSPVCEATARDGPKWGPGVFVDVVVRLTDKEERNHLLRAPKQYVKRTD